MAVLRATAPAQTSRVVASRQRTASRNVAARAFRSSPRTAQPAVEADVVGRRDTIVSGLMLAATLAAAAPAEAFLGIGESTNVEQQYQDETSAILKQVRGVIELPRGDDSAEDKVKDLRKEINKWVAKYRREPKFAGKPSYGNTYSVLNALAGHFNSFGATAPIPKKRLERIVKELDDAEKLLTRNR